MHVLPWQDYDFTRLATGRLFAYVGAGLSQAAGLVGWNDLARRVATFRRDYDGAADDAEALPDDEAANQRVLRAFVEQVGHDGHPILSYPSTDLRTFGRTVLLNLLLRRRSPSGRRAAEEFDAGDLDLHHSLWRARVQGVFTTNYDMLLEEAFHLTPLAERDAAYGRRALRTYRYDARFLRFVLSTPRFVLKLHGDVNDLGTMLFDPSAAWAPGGALHGARGRDLCRALDSARNAGHIVYVGCGARDRTFRSLHATPAPTTPPFERVALVPLCEAGRLTDVHGLQVLTYGGAEQPRAEYAREQLRGFLGALEQATETRPESPAPEAVNIWTQLSQTTMRRWSVSNPWDLRDLSVRADAWHRVEPPEPGHYLWRRRDGDRSPFLSKVAAVECHERYLCAVLEGREVQWDWTTQRGADEPLRAYEWIGPLDASWG